MGLKIIHIDTYLFLEYAPERPNFLEELESREKSGLFRLLVQQLGFSRMGDAILDRLEDAYA